MTNHDLVRRAKAIAFKANPPSDKEQEFRVLSDVVAGLQSTDDPSLVPLWEEMADRLAKLKKELGISCMVNGVVEYRYRVLADPPFYLVGRGSQYEFVTVAKTLARDRADQIAELLNQAEGKL